MPQYLFANPNDETQIVEVFFHMNDKKFYIDENGVEWRRIYTVPQACVDSDFDPRNKDEFIRRGAKYSTLGDLMDKSRELSEKRAEKEGFDPKRREFFDEYARARKGKRHPQDLPKKIDSKYATVDLTAKD